MCCWRPKSTWLAPRPAECESLWSYGAVYSITTFISDMSPPLQIRQVAQLTEHFRLAAAPGSSTRRHRSAPGSARLVRSCRRAGHLRSHHGPRRMRRILTARRIPVRGWCACAGAMFQLRMSCALLEARPGRRFEAQWTFRKTLVQIVRAAFVRGNFSPPGVSGQARRFFTGYRFLLSWSLSSRRRRR